MSTITREQMERWLTTIRLICYECPLEIEDHSICYEGCPMTAAILAAIDRADALERERAARPKIICLCGSTRFKAEFETANRLETFRGNIVLSVGCFPYVDLGASPEEILGEKTKAELDELHKRKIDLADEVLVINVSGYVGKSTRSEIEYARAKGKPIRWLEREGAPTAEPEGE